MMLLLVLLHLKAKSHFNCLKSIKHFKKIIIFDNSNDVLLQKKIKKIYHS